MTTSADIYAPQFEREVICIHCCDIYYEQELIHETRFEYPIALWWCRNPTCDGAGMGHDIHPVNSAFVQPMVWRVKNSHLEDIAQAIETITQVCSILCPPPRPTLKLRRQVKKKLLSPDRMARSCGEV